MANKQHIFFDMDNTIIKSDMIYADMITEFCEKKGLACHPKKVAMGYTNPLMHDLGWNLPLHEQPAILRKMEKFHVEQMRVHGKYIPKIVPGMNEILLQLAKKYDMSLVTVNTRLVANEFLEQLSLSQYFIQKRTLCCTRDRGYGFKPSPDALHWIAKETNCDLNTSIVVGDSAVDINMAHAAGSASIAALWCSESHEILIETKPTLYLEDQYELPEAIDYIFNRQLNSNPS